VSLKREFILYFFVGLNMVLVPANMPRLSFDPCKKKKFVLVPAKIFVFENSPWRDYFKKQNFLQGPV